MKAPQALMWVASGVVGLGLLGCDVSVGGREHSPRETVYVEQRPEYVVVREAPPPFVVERRPPPPSRGHIWIDGYWHWNGHKYVWERGHWAVPPHEHAVWVAPRYERHEQGYRYIPGQWREEGKEREGDRGGREPSPRETVYVEQQPEYVVVREAPPPFVVERRPSPPSRGHIWIDGYWHWNGHKYVWERGHWAVPPHEHAVWVAPRYERHEQGYRYIPGQWREEQRGDEHRDRH